MDTKAFVSYKEKITKECSKVIVGKEDVIEKVLICYLCGGHILLEDVPGTGKTMLLRTFSKAVGGSFKRIQFTPDILPSDLTGIHFYNQKSGEFEFRAGPLFANIVLADEINRATPRTQSSLLEAMEEKQISVDGTTFALEEPFLVMATQNPLESGGTFPLPEAQIDRFFMRLSMGYMSREEEMSVLMRKSSIDILSEVKEVVSAEETASLKKKISETSVSKAVASYIMDIIEKTRNASGLGAGVSTRGALALYKASQVKALFSGRSFVIPEDVKDMAVPVLAHRISGSLGSRKDSEGYVLRLLSEVQVPLESIE